MSISLGVAESVVGRGRGEGRDRSSRSSRVKLTFAVYDTVDEVFAWESLSVQILK